MSQLLTMSELSKEEISEILKDAEDFANGKERKATEQTFVANLFFENSTRTRFSFEVAEKRLGLEVLNFSADSSSVQKRRNVIRYDKNTRIDWSQSSSHPPSARSLL